VTIATLPESLSIIVTPISFLPIDKKYVHCVSGSRRYLTGQ
jgi:hypothetical protein